MTTPQVAAFINQLRIQLASVDSIDEAVRVLRRDLEGMMRGALRPEQEDDLAAATEELRRSLGPVEILRVNSMFRTHTPWYSGPSETDRHWHALRAYLVEAKGWPETTVDGSIGRSSTEIVSLLANPAGDSFAYRGLVIGHVQSGKTANMTAVIAKAVDAGYNLVIILAGITNKLRRQTQGRMEKDLANRLRDLWILQTRPDELGDFKMPPNGGFQMPGGGTVQMAVVKKNVAPLGQLLKTIERTMPVIRRSLRVLIIDDEADQASINTASGEFDMTRINRQIREILKEFPANCYVGYTATPFANVLIDPYADGGRELDDLYPRDFITALPTPDGYFGTERLFGPEPADASSLQPEEEGLDVIQPIKDEEAAVLQPARRADKDTFQPKLPESLKDAVLYFLASSAARRYRGHVGEHMSMLVHTSPYVVMHDRLAGLLGGWIDRNRSDLQGNRSELSERMLTLWEAQQKKVPNTICRLPKVAFSELQPYLGDVLSALQVVVENGTSDDRVDYENGPRTYIVVGGSILARGLTIEGLAVSYFLRSSGQYDTLLQMGRWFGFRPDYEDLPRIWMTGSLSTAFRSLAGIETEIREDVAEYARRRVTPMDFAVRVRSIPGMAITAASKMRAARIVDISYAGKHVQTIRFDHRDERIVRNNWNAASTLISSAEELSLNVHRADELLYRGVPKRLVVQFLRSYSVQQDHRELSASFLLGYIDQAGDALESWNVGVIQTENGALSELALASAGSVRLSRRTRLRHPEASADIKALMSRRDVLFDCEEATRDAVSSDADWSTHKEERARDAGPVPLLLLYPIDRKSGPKEKSQRVALEAIGDLVGIGIVFPGSTEGAGGYYAVELRGASADELDDVEQEIEEQLEAGRVN